MNLFDARFNSPVEARSFCGNNLYFVLFPLLLTVKAGSERAHKLLTHAYTMPIPKPFPISL